MNIMEEHSEGMWSGDNYPCFLSNYDTQIKEINVINLDIKKDNTARIEFITKTEELKKEYTLVYTDASKVNEATGFGVHIPHINCNFLSKLPNNLNICTAEMVAIWESVRICLQKNLKRALILSDSKSAIEKLTRTLIDPGVDYVCLQTKKIIVQAQEIMERITLAWIPGHVGIKGNEIVDGPANLGRTLKVPKKVPLSREDVIARLKTHNNKQHGNHWKQTGETKGKWYGAIQEDFPKKTWYDKLEYSDRRHITTIIRMRTGHVCTAQHLHRMKIIEDPHCECGQVESLEHMFFVCPINKIPNFDLYDKLRESGIDAPLNIKTVLKYINNTRVNLIMRFIRQNSLRL